MKKFFLLPAFLVLAFAGFAQKANTINLKQGEQHKIVISTEMEMELAPGMNMTMNGKSYNTAKVTAATADAYTIETTAERLVVNASVMGQEMNVDSDNESDYDSEMGKEVLKTFEKGKKETFSLNKMTGRAAAGPATASVSPMDNSLTPAKFASLLFLSIPDNAAIGEAWTEEVTVDGVKNKFAYKLIRQDADVAYVDVTGSLKGDSEVKAQGTEVEVETEGTITGTMVVNRKTGMVKKNNFTTDMIIKTNADGQDVEVKSLIKTDVTVD